MWKEFVEELLLANLSAYVLYVFFGTYFEVTGRRKLRILMQGLYAAWQFVSVYLSGKIPSWGMLVCSVICTWVVSCVCFDGTRIGKFIFSIIYNAMWFLSEALVLASYLLLDVSVEKYTVLGSFLSICLLFAIVRLLQLFVDRMGGKYLPWRKNILFLLFPLSSMLLIYHIMALSEKVGSHIQIFISAAAICGVFVMNVVMFAMYLTISKEQEMKKMNSVYKKELELYDKYINEKKSTMQELKKQRHDFKHELMYVYELVQEEKYEQLQDYIEKNNGFVRASERIGIINTGNLLIDSMVNYKYEMAKQYQIPFRAQVNVPETFSFAGADLCVILGNLLDNAIEAQVERQIAEPYIDLKIKYTMGSLAIFVENAFDGTLHKDKKGNLLSSKSDPGQHGIGLQSVKNALLPYQGSILTETAEHIFKVKVVMYPPKQDMV